MNATILESEGENIVPIGSKGPVTTYLHRRNAVLYALLCVLAYMPGWLHLGAGWQAAGLGLLAPGVGFVAAGGWWVLLFPVTLGLFWLSVVAWFWCGIVVAPLSIWLGSAVLAGAATGQAIWAPAVYVVPACALAIFMVFQYRGLKRRQRDRAAHALRQTFFAESLAEVRQKVASEPVPGERELDPDQIAAVRFVLERALQPIDGFKGFTIIDQFQPAALRYQINHMGFALGLVQAHVHAPNFHGYLLEAQRNLIEKYRVPRVWKYWVYESMWGHFNFTHHDPVVRDNIMLSGWFGMHVGQYTLNTGDKRYAEPGSLTFKLNERKVYAHDLHTVEGAVVKNFEHNRFTLFPCEPNWVYPICNMLMVYPASRLTTRPSVRSTSRRSIRSGAKSCARNSRTSRAASSACARKGRGSRCRSTRGSRLRVLREYILAPVRAAAVGRRPQGTRLLPRDGYGWQAAPLATDRSAAVSRQDRPGSLQAWCAVRVRRGHHVCTRVRR